MLTLCYGSVIVTCTACSNLLNYLAYDVFIVQFLCDIGLMNTLIVKLT